MSNFWWPPRIPGYSKRTSQPKNSFSIQGFEHFGRISSQPPAFPFSVFWNLGGMWLQWCIFLTQSRVTSVCPVVWGWLCLKDIWNTPSIHQGCPFRCWVRHCFSFDRSSSVRFFAAKMQVSFPERFVGLSVTEIKFISEILSKLHFGPLHHEDYGHSPQGSANAKMIWHWLHSLLGQHLLLLGWTKELLFCHYSPYPVFSIFIAEQQTNLLVLWKIATLLPRRLCTQGALRTGKIRCLQNSFSYLCLQWLRTLFSRISWSGTFV